MQEHLLPSLRQTLNSLRAENLLGSGGNAEVYRIDDFPELAARKGHGLLAMASEAELHEPQEIDLPLLEGRNFGQPLASCGEGLSILLLQRGEPCGVPPYLRHGPTTEMCAQTYEDATHKASTLPQEAYVELLQDMLFLDTTPYRIDPSKANNMLMDLSAERFRIVDLCQPRDSSLYHNSPEELVVMLFDTSYAYRYKGTREEGLAKDRRVILNRVLSACETIEIPVTKGDTMTSSFAYALSLAGYQEGSPERAAIEERIKRTAVARPSDRASPQGASAHISQASL